MKVNIHIGNLFEVAGGALGIWAVYRYFGLSGALVCAAVLCVIAAELLYDDVVWSLPLPPVKRWLATLRRAVAKLGREALAKLGRRR